MSKRRLAYAAGGIAAAVAAAAGIASASALGIGAGGTINACY